MTSVYNHTGGLPAGFKKSHGVANPFDSDDDESPISNVRSASSSTSSSSRYTNPFDDDGLPHGANKLKPTSGRSTGDSSNAFDVPTELPRNGNARHKPRSSRSSDSSSSGWDASNPFDGDDVSSKPKSRGESILDNGSLFDDEERPPKPREESSAYGGLARKIKAGGSKIIEGGSRIKDLSNVKMPSLPTFSSSSSSLPDEKLGSRRGRSKLPVKDLYGEVEEGYHPSRQQNSYAQSDQSRFADQSVEQLEQHAIRKSQDVTSSVKNCVRIAEDTMGVAGKTMEVLHEQSDQIRRTHEVAVHVDDELSRGEKLLGSLGGMFSKTWKPKKTRPVSGPSAESDPYKRKGHAAERAGLGLQSNKDDRRSRANHSGLSGAQAQIEMEKDKQDDALSDLSNVLGRLKDMTVDMGAELERQNDDLDRVHDDVIVLNERVQGANVRTRRLLGR